MFTMRHNQSFLSFLQFPPFCRPTDSAILFSQGAKPDAAKSSSRVGSPALSGDFPQTYSAPGSPRSVSNAGGGGVAALAVDDYESGISNERFGLKLFLSASATASNEDLEWEQHRHMTASLRSYDRRVPRSGRPC
jgi:hypothetical protein